MAQREGQADHHEPAEMAMAERSVLVRPGHKGGTVGIGRVAARIFLGAATATAVIMFLKFWIVPLTDIIYNFLAW